MGKNIFISYKYKDEKVAPIPTKTFFGEKTICRHYVDELQEILKQDNHINLGEKDGESLADFKDAYIETSLKKKIFRSSVTIVLISKGMKTALSDKDQWIPWEISYSLRTVVREDCTSRMNAVLGIVIPDENNSYDWYYSSNAACDCTTHYTNQLFNILKNNMFNIKNPTIRYCEGIKINEGECSFIKTLKWNEFKNYANYYLNKAIEIRDNKDLYNIQINLD